MDSVQPEVLKDLQDNFSISLQYYEYGQDALSNLYLEKCLSVIDSLLDSRENKELIRQILLNQVHSIANTKAYTYYLV